MRAIALILLLCRSALGAEFVPDDRTALFPIARAQDFAEAVCLQVPDGITGYWLPALTDLRGIEAGLISFLDRVGPRYAKWLRGDAQHTSRWPWLRRQAIGVLKKDARYLLVVYDFEDPAETAIKEKERKARSEKLGVPYRPDLWKRYPLVFHGRGSSYFRVLFDLQKREFVWYEENPSE
jgi:hypothetical protein